MFSNSSNAAVPAMNKTVVASLFCDGPPKGEEYAALREAGRYEVSAA